MTLQELIDSLESGGLFYDFDRDVVLRIGDRSVNVNDVDVGCSCEDDVNVIVVTVL